MGFANGLHWVGVFLIFAASILLLITTISAPVINDISLLKVTLANGTSGHASSLSFGTFGYCVLDAAQGNQGSDYCSKVHIGYDPAHIIANADGSDFHDITSGTSDALTDVMVLHPIACGLAFLAFLISCAAGIVGSLIGALVALLAWILTLVSLAVDFTLFGILHHHVNDNNDDGSGSHAQFGAGIWCVVGAFVALFFGMIIVFFTCCANRREKRRGYASKEAPPPQAGRRKRFGMF